MDWKTGRADSGDPLQLAIYRLAWAEATGVGLDEVAAVFVHVRDDRVVAPRNLAGRAELEQLLDHGPRPDASQTRLPSAR